jgi:chromosome segregation ATPase
MGFFTVGNLITLLIVALALILYRQIDRKNRSLDTVRRYADKLKADLAAFVTEKAEAVKGYGVDLDVERKAASELMKRLQKTTEEELAQKAQAIIKIDERINAYDSSMDELVKMTARVQENLERVREESSFVENVGKRVGEAKNQLEKTEKKLESLELRFEKENAASLEKTAQGLTSSVKSAVAEAELHAAAVERQAAGHRAAVDKIEKDRAASLSRDMAIVNKTLKEAVEKAGLRADRMEEAALIKLKEQAQDRVRKLQAILEEKIKTAQETARARIGETQDMLKQQREEWKMFRDEWKKDLQDLNTLARDSQASWKTVSAEAEQQLLKASDSRMEEYKAVQAEQYRQLVSLADDMAALDGELRLSMDETVNRVRQDFERFEEETSRSREKAAGEFFDKVQILKTQLGGVETELNTLKNSAYENVSEKLKVFEDDFFADLTRRSADIEKRLAEWQGGMEERLKNIAEEAEERRRETELAINEELSKNLAGQGDTLAAGLEHLKEETGAFEEGIREQMRGADDSRRSFLEQLDRSLTDAREAAEGETRAEIGRYALSMADTLKRNRRELEDRLKEMSDSAGIKNEELSTLMESARKNVEEWQTAYTSQIRGLESDMEDLRRRLRETALENEERSGQIRGGLEDLRGDLAGQTRLFERSGELRTELERRIEDLSGDLDRLDQRKNEVAQLENQYTRIKRLEEDVLAKESRIMSEQHRLETMEKNFNRLLLTAQAVEEKLVQVRSSDDTLQAVQVQLRRLDDAIRETDEKHQRIERKNQTLEETTDGIDRNFKALQASEAALKQLNGDYSDLSGGIADLKASIESLSAENEKAKETAGKLSYLDETLSGIEKRIREMQKAREWLANTETRMEELYKQAEGQVKLLGDILRDSSGKAEGGTGAPPISKRENVVSLARRGWKKEEIAKSLKISVGEVELILEMGRRE